MKFVPAKKNWLWDVSKPSPRILKNDCLLKFILRHYKGEFTATPRNNFTKWSDSITSLRLILRY
jgi:hypothetical protein